MLRKIKRVFRKHYAYIILRNLFYSIKANKLFSDLASEKRLFAIKDNYLKKHSSKEKVFLFYPEFPSFGYLLYQVARVLGCKLSRDPHKKFDVAIDWSIETKREDNEALNRLSNSHKIINLKCRDISKSNVEKKFKEAFGYGTFVDPLEFEGYAVMKSDENATHDGKIIKCPIKENISTNHIFQRVINNRIDEKHVLDLRVYIVGKNIPFVARTYRSLENRFDNVIEYKKISAEDVFSENEIEKILLFSQNIGLDYGELDVLRDVDTEEIYIIDANTTPYGNSYDLDSEEWENIILSLAEAFYGEFISD